MRKVISLLIVFVLIFAFSACGKEEIFDIGKIKDGVYINDYMDIKATLPEGFEFMSDDEAKKAFGVTELYSEGSAFGYGAFATSETGASLNFTFENTALSREEKCTAEGYLNETLDSMFSLSSYCVVDYEKGVMNFGGEDIHYMDIELSVDIGTDTVEIFERMAIKEKEEWICIINAASQYEADIETLFSGIEM